MGKGGRALVAFGCVASLALGAGGAYFFGPLGGTNDTEHITKVPPSELRIERSERAYPLSGVILADGVPMDDATVTAGGQSIVTDETGAFSFAHAPVGVITVSRPAYETLEYQFDGSVEEVDLTIEPVIVKALFADWATLASDTKFSDMLDIAATTTVNGLVFEVKDDLNGGWVYYDSQVPAAIDSGSVLVKYDVEARLGQAQADGLYTIARIPAFASKQFTATYPDLKIKNGFLDPRNPEAWEYPLALAVEACGFGFDEIQFDYVRFPEGYDHSLAPNQADRVAYIQGFLEEASERLHPLGCAVSADTFGIIQVTDGDEGIGQKVEETTSALDAHSPMIYPADQWGGLGGYIGIANPPANPGDTVAAILDISLPRTEPGVITRPLLQGFSVSSSAVIAQIRSCEDRGLGWIIWNFLGNIYFENSLPDGTTGRG